MIKITPTITIDESEIKTEFIRASGPGGQNVNKVATAVQLRFNVGKSQSLNDDVRERLKRLAGKRMSEDGVLIITARRFRSQDRNRKDAMERLAKLIHTAAQPPKLRRKTKPTHASNKRRLKAKQHRAEIKRLRRSNPASED